MIIPVRSITLNDEEKIVLEKKLADIYACLSEVAVKLYGNSSNASILELRNTWNKSPEALNDFPEAQEKLKEAASLESLVLAGYVGCVVDISLKYLNNEQDKEDMFNEGMMRMWNCMYLYNGNTRFTTFIYVAISRLMINFRLQKKRRCRILDEMLQEVSPSSALRSKFVTMPETHVIEWGDFVNYTLSDANLSLREKETIEAYMELGRGFQRVLAENWQCSRSNVGLYFTNAKKKLQRYLKVA